MDPETGGVIPAEAMDQPKTAEQVGAERLQAAGELVSNAREAITTKWRAVSGKLSKAGGFLGRLGLKLLAPDVIAKDAAVATGEAAVTAGKYVGGKATEAGTYVAGKAVEAGTAVGGAAVKDWEQTIKDYEYVSDAVKTKAGEIGSSVEAAYGRAVVKKNEIVAAADKKVEDIKTSFSTKRAEIVGRISDAVLRARVESLTQSRESLASKLAKVDAELERLQGSRAAA